MESARCVRWAAGQSWDQAAWKPGSGHRHGHGRRLRPRPRQIGSRGVAEAGSATPSPCSRHSAPSPAENEVPTAAKHEHSPADFSPELSPASAPLDAAPAKPAPPLTWRLPERYELRELLGTGSYGSVCEAADLERGRMVAVKRLRHVFSDPVHCKRILRELALLSRLDHTHVVRLYDIATPAEDSKFDELYIVMELGDADLKTLFRKDVTLVPAQVNWVLYNLLVGLKYLHSAGILHRDLKPSNVLVNQNCAVKICDFGLARTVGEELDSLGGEEDEAPRTGASKAWRVMTKHVVTRFYRAPELILLQDRYTEAIDVWSVGCIYAELTQMLALAPEERGPLFPGSSCFPLSPDRRHRHDALLHSRAGEEQLNVIFDVLGTPAEAEVQQLEREDARSYIRCFAPRLGFGIQNKLPMAEPLAVDLLERMLSFSPVSRISVEEALAHQLLADIRDPETEISANGYITLEFEQEPEMSEEQLRCCFAQEIQGFHRARAR